MALVPLPGVGTNWHTLKLTFQGNQISVYYDGLQVVQMTDNNVDGLAPYTSGAAGAHMYLGDQPYQATFDDVSITPLPANSPPTLPVQTNRTIPPLVTMVVTNTATDSDSPPNPLTYSLTGPSGANINANGVITWSPSVAQDQTTNIFTTVVTDFNSSAPPAMQHLSATNTFTVVVNGKAAVVADTTAMVQESCTPTNNAVDPGETVTMLFSLRDIGFGNTTNLIATLLQANGVISPSAPRSYGALAAGGSSASQPFTFTATGSCGGNVSPTFQLQDGSYNLGTATFTIPFGQLATAFTQNFDSVSAPALPAGWTTSASGAQANWVTQNSTNNTAPNAAFSPDALNIGVNELVSPAFAMPPGISQLSFSHYYDLEVNTATEGYDGGVLEIKIGANAFTDILAAGGSFVANGYDHTINNTFGNPLGGRQAWSGTSSGFITTLVNLPAAAANQNVQFKWRCGTDNGNGGAGWRVDSVGIKARVCCALSAPLVVSDTSSLTVESCAPANNAIDPGETVTMVLGLKDVGSANTTNLVATLLTTNGIVSPSAPQTYGALVAGGPTVSQPFSFTATGSCGGTITATLRLQDGSLNLGTVSFPLTLGPLGSVFTQSFDTVTAPGLPAGWTTSSSGYQSNWFTITSTNNTPPNAVFSVDATNIGVNELVSPVFTASADTTQLFFRNYYDLEAFDSSTGYDGGVLEIKVATNDFVDILTAGGSFVSGGYTHTISTSWGNPLGGRRAWSGTSPGFTNTVVNLPAIAGQSYQVRWRCGTDNGIGRTGWRLDAIGVTGRSCCVNSSSSNTAPVLPTQTNRTVAELTALVVTNTASDTDIPANSLSYILQNAPAGATIDPNGIINWTPTEAQGPSTNAISTVVTDNGVPPLSATNSFTVVVAELNNPPVLPQVTNYTIVGASTLIVTNHATDSDTPANSLSYTLVTAPTNALINTNGVISWTPAMAQVPSTNIFKTVVTDFNPSAINTQHLSATNQFTVVVNPIHVVPVLPVQTNRTVLDLTTLIVTNSASANDIPPLPFVYQLAASPSGAIINSNGIITWTPATSQYPTTNIITTIVNDGSGLSATNSFLVFVKPPVITIESITVSNRVAIVTWTAVVGQKYRIQYKEDPIDTNWTDLLPDIEASGPSATATNGVATSGQRFYRVYLIP